LKSRPAAQGLIGKASVIHLSIRPGGLKSLFVRVALCACAAAAPHAFGQSATPQAAGAAAVGKAAEVKMKLTPEEERMLRNSKSEIVATGFSESYFDAHFEPVRVMNTPGDRRITWRFRVGEHEALVQDSLGFYTDSAGRRVDAHTVSATLGRTHDILRTISLARARRVMRACIGEFEGGSVTLQRFGEEGRAALVFTAISVPPRPSAKEPPLPPGKKKPFLSIGSVDLETGQCVKGVAQVGSPLPPAAPPARRPRPRR
jgi:hypothetical protein